MAEPNSRAFNTDYQVTIERETVDNMMMMPTAVRSGVLALVTALGVTAAAHAQEVHLTGRYVAEGTNPDGKPYRSIVQIEQDGDTYLVRWLEPAGQPVAIGIGMVRGDWLSVSYLGGRRLGVVVYHIEKGPQLKGQWTVLGADGTVWPETLSKVGVAAEQRDAPSDHLAAAAPSTGPEVTAHSTP